MRNALDIFYIMLMLNLPSSKHHAVGCKNQSPEPAIVRVSETAYPNERKQKRCVKLAETADK